MNRGRLFGILKIEVKFRNDSTDYRKKNIFEKWLIIESRVAAILIQLVVLSHHWQITKANKKYNACQCSLKVCFGFLKVICVIKIFSLLAIPKDLQFYLLRRKAKASIMHSINLLILSQICAQCNSKTDKTHLLWSQKIF